MKRLHRDLSLEDKIRNLPGKRPPTDLRKRIMSALPEYREPWLRRVMRAIGTGPLVYRTVGALASLILTFYGGMQFEQYFHGSPKVSNELTAASADMNDEAYFYLGRSLLAAGEAIGALNAFGNAEKLRPENLQYALWKAIAYQNFGALDEERRMYRQLLGKRPDFLPARLNLANNLLQDGQASQAQQLYEQILERYPMEGTALYNRAIALRMQSKPEEEAEAWKRYLDHYRTGLPADRAVQHLHELGDYSFRIYQLGQKSVILNQDRLLDPHGYEQNSEIDYLARHLGDRSLGKLNIVVFVQDDAPQAKLIARSLLTAIANRSEEIEKDSVGVSWFDEAEPLESLAKGKIHLSKGVLLFSAMQTNLKEEKKI